MCLQYSQAFVPAHDAVMHAGQAKRNATVISDSALRRTLPIDS